MNIPNDYHSSIYSGFSGRNVRMFCNVEFNFQRSQTEVDSKNYLLHEGLNLTDLGNSETDLEICSIWSEDPDLNTDFYEQCKKS